MNLLFPNVGRRSYLIQYFKKALNGDGVIHAADSDQYSPAFKFSDRHVITPTVYDKTYISFLLDYCTLNGINAIIPMFDVDLTLLSCNRHFFENIGVKVIVSSEEIISICCDKWKTYDFCLRNSIAVPKTYLSVDDVLSDVKSERASFPLIIKPRWGRGSISLFEAENESELKVLYQKTKNFIMSSCLRYETDNELNKVVLIQEKLKGQEYGMDVINDLKGNYQNTIVKKKYTMRSGSTECAETVDNVLIKKLGYILSQRLKHVANLDVDLFLVGDTPYLLEMNPRFGGGYPFSNMAGVDLPLAIIKWINKEPVSEEILREKFGVISYKNTETIQISMCEENPCIGKYNVSIIKSQKTISRLLVKFNNYFSPPLQNRIKNFNDYACKLQKNAITLLITDKKTGDAFASFYANDDVNRIAYLAILAVDESYQKFGIGKSLLNKVEKISKDKGMKHLKLCVHLYNTTAIAFYVRNGYSRCGCLGENDIYMIKNLG